MRIRMTKEVLVTISGLQFSPETESESVELITSGSYYKKNGKHYIIYDEVNEGFSETTRNIIKLNDLVGDNIAHYNLPAAQQSAIENYLNIRSFPSYRLFDKEGNLVDVKVDARQLDNLEKIIKELNR